MIGSFRSTVRRPRTKSAKPLLRVEELERRDLLSGVVPLAAPLTPFSHPLVAGTAVPIAATPAQIGHAYGFDRINFLNPWVHGSPVKGDGSGQTIAIIDAYDNPDFVDSTSTGFANSDLHQFDLEFGLPDPPSFSKIDQTGGTSYPQANTAWAEEIALDVEWSHALAPGASILLVEARSSNGTDLYQAAHFAATQPGVSVVSMSFGTNEFGPTSTAQGETSYDYLFTTPAGHQGVTFVSGSGDKGVLQYPAASHNVLAVGGTNWTVDSSGNLQTESGWWGSGGGISQYESQPGYQQGVVTQSRTNRTAPDVAFDAYRLVDVYNSYDNGATTPWGIDGGTSLGAPAWAALLAIADQGRARNGLGTLGGQQAMQLLYQVPLYFNDITTGAGNNSAGPGYDLLTGLGSPKADLITAGLGATLSWMRDGSVVREASSTQVYVIYGGAKFYIPNAQELYGLGFNLAYVQVLPDGALAYTPTVPRDNTLVRELSSAPVYLIEGGAKFWIPSPQELYALGYNWSEVHVVPDGSLASIPNVPRDGTLVRELSSAPVYLIEGGAKFWVPSPQELYAMGYNWSEVKIVPDGSLSSIPNIPVNGTLVRELSSAAVYVIFGGAKFWIPSPQELYAMGYNWSEVRIVPDGSLASIPNVPSNGTLLRELDSSNVYIIHNGHKYLIDSLEMAELGYTANEIHVVGDGDLSIFPQGTLEVIVIDIPRMPPRYVAEYIG
jgi:hypothetical protein